MPQARERCDFVKAGRENKRLRRRKCGAAGISLHILCSGKWSPSDHGVDYEIHAVPG